MALMGVFAHTEVVLDRENADVPGPVEFPSRVNRLRDWVDERRTRLESARTTSPTVGFAFDAFSYDADTGAPVLAAALGFRVFLFQVPYACAVVIATSYVADLTDREPASLFHGRGVTGLMSQSVADAGNLSGWARASAFFLSL